MEPRSGCQPESCRTTRRQAIVPRGAPRSHKGHRKARSSGKARYFCAYLKATCECLIWAVEASLFEVPPLRTRDATPLPGMRRATQCHNGSIMNGTTAWLNELLRDIAQKVQLPPSRYAEAVTHYEAVAKFLEADGSPLRPHGPLLLYPQGSFRIQSTISSRLDHDEFDIDLMLELNNVQRTEDPDTVLDLVVKGLTRERDDGRYRGCRVTKKKRCVTVEYEEMHLDITPAVLIDGAPRTSVIFDRHPDRPSHVVSNPEGFARAFEDATLPRELVLAMERALPVPEQKPLEAKSDQLLALQLLKRHRNVLYERGGNKPPSVLLAWFTMHAPRGDGLIGQLARLALSIEQTLARGPLRVENPACPQENFADRWPANQAEQNRFAKEMGALRKTLIALHESDEPLSAKRDVLRSLFGEAVTNLAFEALNERIGSTGQTSGVGWRPRTGIVLPVAATGGQTVAPHTFFGGPDREGR